MSHDDDEYERPEYTGPWVVCLYLMDRAYGGAEEGGWYYTYGDPVLTTHLRCFALLEDAWLYARSLDPLVDQVNEGRPSISRVASEGEYAAIICDGWPKHFPEDTPHYE